MKHLLIGAVAALGLTAMPALAEFPENDLQGIIQWGAGGSTDVVMRAVTPHAEEVLGAEHRAHQPHRRRRRDRDQVRAGRRTPTATPC